MKALKTKSTFSPDGFDDLRSRHPDLAINLYAMTPGGAVTLEVLTPDGATFNWSAPTAAEAFALAFPVEASAEPETPPIPETDIFD